MAEAVKKNAVGYVMPVRKEDVISFVNTADKKELESIGINARRLWDTTYNTYVDTFFSTIYCKILK